MHRTSDTHPIRVNAITFGPGLLGMTLCPGKHGDSLTGTDWARDLDTDLTALRDWGTDLLVTLIEPHEFDLLRVPELGDRTVSHGMAWMHLPIVDQGVPGAEFDGLWPAARADMLGRLEQGGRVVLHCRGGLGRTGLVAALLLVETGMDREAAIRHVRDCRPGTIETHGQEQYIRAYRTSTG